SVWPSMQSSLETCNLVNVPQNSIDRWAVLLPLYAIRKHSCPKQILGEMRQGAVALLQWRLQNDFAETSLNALEEGATMVQVASLFNQLLHHFPRLEFAALVKKHKAERAAKGFDCWTQFVAMLFCQLGHTDSLREICNGLSCCLGKLVHLGIAQAPNKSTLSYANQHRPAA